MLKRTWLAAAVFGLVAAATGCGGGGGSDAPQGGNVSVLLTDAPLLTVNGRSFAELNVDITALEASVPGTRSFTAQLTLVAGQTTTVNLLDLNNDQEWLAVATLPPGTYDALRLTIDPTTAHLIEDNASNTRQALVLHPANANGTLTIHLAPPLVITSSSTTSSAQHLVLVDWVANQSVHFNPSTGDYVLSGHFVAHSVNRAAAPLPFRALPGRLTAVDATSGEMRIRLERHSAAQYLVRTNASTSFEDMQGNALTINDFAPGDFVVLTGTVDGNTDIDATRVRKLPSSNHVPPAGPGGGHPGHPGGGHTGGGNPGGGSGTVPSAVFAVGAVSQLDLAANTFQLRTPRGPIDVVYSDTATNIFDATVRPPQPTNENALGSPNPNRAVVVEVAGRFVPPATANALPTIDATGANGPPARIVIIRR